MENFDPIQSLSPIHYRAADAEEKQAYEAAYEKLVRYHGHDEMRANYFSQILQDALYRRNPHMLMVWYVGKNTLDL